MCSRDCGSSYNPALLGGLRRGREIRREREREREREKEREQH